MSGSPSPMRELRRDLFRRVLGHAKAGTTDLAADAMRIDPATYFDEANFERERIRLFRETPLLVCLSPDLPEPGSFRIFDDSGVPIVVSRGSDGQVRAFLNVCRHRGGRVVSEESGRARRFTCRYHGWTYDTSGSVVGVPSEQFFCGRIDTERQLVECPAEERHGMVFVQASPGGTMDLDAHLGDFGAELERLDFAGSEPFMEQKFQSTSNWKFAMDTYLESYHLPTLHRDTFAHVFESNLFLLDMFGPHYRFTFPHKGLEKWIGRPEEEWPIDAMPITYFLFPNTIIAVGSVSANGSSFTTHRLFPTSVGEMYANVRMYGLNGIQSPEHRAEMASNFEKIKGAAADEDYAVTGESWGALSALPEDARFLLGRHEIGVQNFHRNIALAMNQAGEEVSLVRQ
ncbi:MAG: aromatic ring-hydroxylating dioxygenase subunit alpha [Novosphingobium sp.]|nr:aromatic ring-hydroxylating dioxygenase subunit alpha [Novosphingobium sp.]MCP5403145.1 aromatic ring-hydroxylating dioxygenase subunit alpha [Novosphingobium sp.]